MCRTAKAAGHTAYSTCRRQSSQWDSLILQAVLRSHFLRWLRQKLL